MGWFTLLTEAESVEAAGEKFRELIEKLYLWYGAFQNHVQDVYVSSIVEVKMLPDEGVLAHFEVSESTGHVEAPALLGVSGESCVSYEVTSTGDEGHEKPFVSLKD